MEKKKILILANSVIGLYKFRKELLEELVKEGYSVVISCPNDNQVFKDNILSIGIEFVDTEIDRRGMNPLRDIKLIKFYKYMVSKINPDLVISYTIKPNIYGSLICRFKKISYIANITGLGTSFQRDNLFKKFIIIFYRLSLSKVKVVFFENEFNKELFIENRIITSNQAFKLNGAGVNTETYPHVSLPSRERIRFLYIGRIMKEKGIDELIEVAKRMKLEHMNVEFHLIGDFEENYKKILEELQEKGIIFYHGFQNEIFQFVKDSHCVILPSHHEGMANTLLESGAMGRPLIASNIPGCKEAILDGESGYVFEVKNVNELYLKIKKFLNLKDYERQEMGKKSRLHIERVFDKKIVVNETIKRIKLWL